MVYLASQTEPGHCCPLTMTYAATPVLRRAEGLDGWAWACCRGFMILGPVEAGAKAALTGAWP